MLTLERLLQKVEEREKEKDINATIKELLEKDLNNVALGRKSNFLANFIKDEFFIRSYNNNFKKTFIDLDIKSARAVIGLAFICSNNEFEFVLYPLDNKTIRCYFRTYLDNIDNKTRIKYIREYNLIDLPLREEEQEQEQAKDVFQLEEEKAIMKELVTYKKGDLIS